MATNLGPELITAAEMGRRGGTARAKKLTAEERAESARNAARARWAKKKNGGGGGNGGGSPEGGNRPTYLLSDIKTPGPV